MTRRVHCGKKTKIYIPKTVNPQIISYRSASENDTVTELHYMPAHETIKTESENVKRREFRRYIALAFMVSYPPQRREQRKYYYIYNNDACAWSRI